MKTWKELKRGDRVWINGETGEIGKIKKTLIDDSLEEVQIETWIHTSKFLIGRYPGPTIIFYSREAEKVAISDFCAADLIEGKIYESGDEITTQDNSYIISLTEQEGEIAREKIEKHKRELKINDLNSTIEGLEEDIKEKEDLILSLRGELRKILEQKDEET